MVAPLAATAAFWALAYIAGAVQAKSLPFGGDPNAAFGMLFLYLLFGLPIAYFVTFAVVYPLFLCLRWRGRLTRRAILVASALVGVSLVGVSVVFTVADERFALQDSLIGLACGCLAGIVGGFVFVRLFPFEIELRAVAIPGRAA